MSIKKNFLGKMSIEMNCNIYLVNRLAIRGARHVRHTW